MMKYLIQIIMKFYSEDSDGYWYKNENMIQNDNQNLL